MIIKIFDQALCFFRLSCRPHHLPVFIYRWAFFFILKRLIPTFPFNLTYSTLN